MVIRGRTWFKALQKSKDFFSVLFFHTASRGRGLIYLTFSLGIIVYSMVVVCKRMTPNNDALCVFLTQNNYFNKSGVWSMWIWLPFGSELYECWDDVIEEHEPSSIETFMSCPWCEGILWWDCWGDPEASAV